MIDYFDQKVLLAVRERRYASWRSGNQCTVRVIGDVKHLRPGEIPLRLKLKIPRSLLRGAGPVEVIIPEDAIEVIHDNAR